MPRSGSKRHRLGRCLNGLGTSAGLKRMGSVHHRTTYRDLLYRLTPLLAGIAVVSPLLLGGQEGNGHVGATSRPAAPSSLKARGFACLSIGVQN